MRICERQLQSPAKRAERVVLGLSRVCGLEVFLLVVELVPAVVQSCTPGLWIPPACQSVDSRNIAPLIGVERLDGSSKPGPVPIGLVKTFEDHVHVSERVPLIAAQPRASSAVLHIRGEHPFYVFQQAAFA